jgi:hypothetical protein
VCCWLLDVVAENFGLVQHGKVGVAASHEVPPWSGGSCGGLRACRRRRRGGACALVNDEVPGGEAALAEALRWQSADRRDAPSRHPSPARSRVLVVTPLEFTVLL